MLLYQISETLFSIYTVMLFIRILSSWFPEYREHRFIVFVARYTDPYLNFFRQYIPPIGMIDVSPIVAFFALNFINYMVGYLILLFVK